MNGNATRTRETIAQKGARYLTAGRLRVTAVSGTRIRAVCTGTEGVYTLGHDDHRGWWCSCPARVPVCCHVSALQTVVRPPLPLPARCVSCGHLPGCDCPEECVTDEAERALFARAAGN